MIDSHCHLADEQFAADLDAVVARAHGAGVDGALCILDALNHEEAARADRVAEAWPEAAFAVGVHPHQAGAVGDAIGGPDGVAPFVRGAVEARAGACAIGEIGLDYHYDFAPRETQIDVFRRQIALARELRRPIVIHTREADDDTVDALHVEGRGGVRGVFHCFTGDAAFARRGPRPGLSRVVLGHRDVSQRRGDSRGGCHRAAGSTPRGDGLAVSLARPLPRPA